VSTHNGTSWSVSDCRRFVWSDWLPVMELDASDPNDVTILRKYTWGLDLSQTVGGAGGIGGLLATEDVADTKDYYYLYDANGNVGQVLDASDGSIAAKYEYDPYGNNLLDPTDPNESGPYAADNPFRFSTKYWDDETGLGYWGYRYYNPRLGRWVSRDPAAEAGGLNLFAYVENEAPGYIDTLGTQQYTYDTELCGAYRIDEYTRSFDNTEYEGRYKRHGMDPGYVRSFDVTFLPKHTEDGIKGFKECCIECCDGGIRVIQAIDTWGTRAPVPVIDDPKKEIKGKNRKDPKGCPPPGYREGGGLRGRRGKYSHCDSPMKGDGSGADIEVCTMCTKKGRDVLLGCVSFQWYDGTAANGWRDRGLRNVSTDRSVRISGNEISYVAESGPMGKTFSEALKRWNKLAGSEAGQP